MFQRFHAGSRRRPASPLSAFEVCEPRQLLSGVTVDVGLVKWGTLTQSRTDSAKFREVDSRDYRFEVKVGQRIAFDLDPKKTAFQGSLQLFDPEGTLLAENEGGIAPRESASEGYLEWTAPAEGTYLLRISSPSGGKFKLQTTPLNVVSDQTANGGSVTRGTIAIPNPGKHLKSTSIALERVSLDNSVPANAIESGVRTWIVIHGRIDSSDSFRSLARTVAAETGDQVLLLDWSQGAADNLKKPGNFLDGAEWIPSVGVWLAEYLKQKGISADQTYLIGHSWGSYVAYETAEQFGTVRGIIALDPARTGYGYPLAEIDFAEVSSLSWAFDSAGPLGSESLAATADESFTLRFDVGNPDVFSKHQFVVSLFEELIGTLVPGVSAWDSLFSLQRFVTPTPAPWKPDQYENHLTPSSPLIFEGVFKVNPIPLTASREWILEEFQYVDAVTELTVVLDA